VVNVTALANAPPVVTAPADIVTAALGATTMVELGEATAFDDMDGVIPATADMTGPFAPGHHQIEWSATDSSGYTGYALQFVDVQPLVEFGPDQLVEPAATVKIQVSLNGEAAAYPVDVNYVFYEDSSTTPSGAGSVLIAEGIKGYFDYVVPGHIQNGNISFRITTASNAVKGPIGTHTVSVVGENIAPLSTLQITQIGRQTRTVASDGGLVSVQAVVQDANALDIHSFDWSASDNILLAFMPTAFDNQFFIDPIGLSPGIYKLGVTVTDDGSPNLGIVNTLYFEVVNTLPVLTNEDSDGDGIDDVDEGYGDADNDGIPDYLDGLSNPALMQTRAGIYDKWLLNAQAGLTIRLGKFSLAAGHHNARLSAQDISQIAGSLGGVVPANAADSFVNLGGLFDFEIHGLTRPGQSILLVIPQSGPIPQDAVYRKYTEAAGWTNFVEDINNALFSAAGEEGICPPPGDPAFVPGLNQGHYCVQLLIEDGGGNDTDRIRNAVVEDPGGVAIASVSSASASAAASSSGGGGGSVGPFMLLLLLGIYPLSARLKRRDQC
jgi:hypothetical protein